jgi:tetratricopeptide (TPR) repeat protein
MNKIFGLTELMGSTAVVMSLEASLMLPRELGPDDERLARYVDQVGSNEIDDSARVWIDALRTFRKGDFQAAQLRLDQRPPGLPVGSWFAENSLILRSMILHQLGETPQARLTCARAYTAVSRRDQELASIDETYGWQQHCSTVAHTLLREATDLLNIDTTQEHWPVQYFRAAIEEAKDHAARRSSSGDVKRQLAERHEELADYWSLQKQYAQALTEYKLASAEFSRAIELLASSDDEQQAQSLLTHSLASLGNIYRCHLKLGRLDDAQLFIDQAVQSAQMDDSNLSCL